MNKRPFTFLSGPGHWGALEIAGIYLILGSAWILFSDEVAARIARTEEMLSLIGLWKGAGYVLVTALLLYWLIRRHTTRLQADEVQLRNVLDALPVLISYVDADRHYRFTNQAYTEWFGESAQGKHLEEALGPEAYQTISKYVDGVLNGETIQYETEIPYRDGGERYVNATYIPDRAANGRVKGFFVFVQDITERKLAQAELRQWADAFEGCAHGIAIDDPNTNRISVCNPAFAKMLKCRAEEIVGSAILSLYVPSDHEYIRHQVEKSDQIGHVRFEAKMIRKDRSTFPVEMDLVSVLGDNGELLYRVTTAQDISERKSINRKLKESEAKYRTLVENLPAITYISGPDQYIGVSYISPQIEALGFDINTWLADPEYWFRQIHPEDQGRVRSELQRFEAGGEPFRAEYRLMLPNGETRWFHDESITVKDASGRPLLKQGFMMDITETKQAEENLRRFQLLSEHSRDIILFIRYEDGRILDANAAALQAYQYTREELLGLTIQSLRADHTQSLTADQMAQADARGVLFETIHRRKDGTTFPVEVSSQGATISGVRSLISIVRDITDRKQTQEALQLKDELLRLTSEIAKVGGWEFDPITGKGTWTDEVARIHDLDPAQETSVEIGLGFYVGESRQNIEQAVQEAIKLGKPYDLELEMITAKGKHKWVRTMALPTIENGKVVKVQGIFQDITERKQTEKALKAARDELELKVQERTAALSEANALLRALMDNIPDHIYFKDRESRFIRNSRSQAILLGLSDPRGAIGKTDFDFFPHAAKSYAEEQEVMRSGKPLVDYEEWVVWPDGREMWVSTTKMPLRNSSGQT
ncbi:MAG TPA: PAS domain S-box protein, partial [Anaerolineales bacterium]